MVMRILGFYSGDGLTSSGRAGFLADSGLSKSEVRAVIQAAESAALRIWELDRKTADNKWRKSDLPPSELERLEQQRRIIIEEMEAQWHSTLGTESSARLREFLSTSIRGKIGRHMVSCAQKQGRTELFTIFETLSGKETNTVQAVAVADGAYTGPQTVFIAEAAVRSPTGRVASAKSGASPLRPYGFANAILPIWIEDGTFSGTARFGYACPGAPPVFIPD